MAQSKLSVRMIGLFAAALLAAGGTRAETLWVGFDTQSPIELYNSTNGALLGSFGPAGATAAALDTTGGHAFIAVPGTGNTTISEFDASQHLLSSFVFSSGIDNGNGSPNFISDMAWGGSNTLWLAGFDGVIYHVNATTGQILSSFNTGVAGTGITTDGTSLYTTDGQLQGTGNIEKYSLTGQFLSTIFTGLPESTGIAFDSSDSTFWVGSTNAVSKIGLSGSTNSTIDTALFIPNTQHSGIEVGSLTGVVLHSPLGTPIVPEPSASWLTGLAVALVFIGKRARWRSSARATNEN